MTASAARPSSSEGLFAFSCARLRGLCRAAGLEERADEMQSLLARLLEPWGSWATGGETPWPSLVGDDGTSVEFSIAFGDEPEVRILVEPIAPNPSLEGNAHYAMNLLESLSQDYPLDLARLARLRDLFLPSTLHGGFGIWLAVGVSGGRTPEFKVYLNPEAHGRDRAPAVIDEALVRLGFPRSWPIVGRQLIARGPGLDELKYFSLDLSPSAESRVKVYARHQQATVLDLECAAAACPAHVPGDIIRFLNAVAPNMTTFRGRAPLTCYAFVQGRGAAPSAVTTHFPVNGYAPNDLVVRERVVDCLERLEISPETYAECLKVFANRPLVRGIGLQAYASFRRHHGRPRLTVYLPVEAYRPGTVAKPSPRVRPSGIDEVVQRLRRSELITSHPFFRRLAREQPNPRHLACFLSRWAAFSSERALHPSGCDSAFREPQAKLLSRTIAVVDGASSGTALQPLVANSSTSTTSTADEGVVDEGLGIADEIVGTQIAELVSYELRRCEGMVALSSEWLMWSARHAERAIALGNEIPPKLLDAAWVSASERFGAAWRLLDDVYAACYCRPE